MAPLKAEVFEGFTQGRTFDTSTPGLPPYGIESFLPDRQVIWRDGLRCVSGIWCPQGELICFDYENWEGDPFCWAYRLDDSGLTGLRDGSPTGDRINLTPVSGPISCTDFLGA